MQNLNASKKLSQSSYTSAIHKKIFQENSTSLLASGMRTTINPFAN